MKAIVAVTASMLRFAYYMLTRRPPYQDLGAAISTIARARTIRRLLQRLAKSNFVGAATSLYLFGIVDRCAANSDEPCLGDNGAFGALSRGCLAMPWQTMADYPWGKAPPGFASALGEKK
jgi:hypothetical protein